MGCNRSNTFWQPFQQLRTLYAGALQAFKLHALHAQLSALLP
jgi:hypothetical protein